MTEKIKIHDTEVGEFYWVRQVYENIWRPCYVAQDNDGREFITVLGIKFTQYIDLMGAEYFEAIHMPRPAESEKCQEK